MRLEASEGAQQASGALHVAALTRLMLSMSCLQMESHGV